MSQLYQVFRTAFPIDTPEQCDFSGISKVIVPRNRRPILKSGEMAVVVVGAVIEEVETHSGRVAVVDVYKDRAVIFGPVGHLRAWRETHLIVLAPGWKAAMPEVHSAVLSMREKLFRERTARMASAMTDTVAERIRIFLKTNPDTRSPTVVAKMIGASREMCSRVLIDIRQEEEA
jgi:hypothetical protein